MPPLSLLIKPASGSCNLNCSYCFYADVMDNRSVHNRGMMKTDVMISLIDRALDYAEHQMTFMFQGGEPTLIGIDFYEAFVKYVNEKKSTELQVNYSLQTNGILIDDTYAAFFAKNNFLIGVSLDGPKDIHDMNRKDAKQDGSYKQVMKTITLLRKHKVDFNILSVVNKAVAKHPAKVYQFFMKEGFRFLQFIPCLDELGKPRGSNPYALLPADYATFLCKLFDLWYKDFIRGHRVSIRTFDNILSILMGNPPESCDMVGVCSTNLVIEADGTAYPCDFYVLDEWQVGNINDDTIEVLSHSETAKAFVEKSYVRDEKCENCPYLPICRGGCRRHRAIDSTGPLTLNYFCSAYNTFYEYSLDRFKYIANVLYREQQR